MPKAISFALTVPSAPATGLVLWLMVLPWFLSSGPTGLVPQPSPTALVPQRWSHRRAHVCIKLETNIAAGCDESLGGSIPHPTVAVISPQPATCHRCHPSLARGPQHVAHAVLTQL